MSDLKQTVMDFLIRDVEAEAGNGRKVPLPLPLWLFILNVKNFDVVQFFVKYKIKFFAQETNISQQTFLKIGGSLHLRPVSTPINSKINHATYQRIFRSKSG